MDVVTGPSHQFELDNIKRLLNAGAQSGTAVCVGTVNILFFGSTFSLINLSGTGLGAPPECWFNFPISIHERIDISLGDFGFPLEY
jgi:hypothetical protein